MLAPVAYAGDLDGDGLTDVLVGAPDSNASAVCDAAVHLFRGDAGEGILDVPIAVIPCADEKLWFGCVVSSAGDVDGDGEWKVIEAAESVPACDGAYDD